MPAAVKLFEWEATRKRWRGLSGTPLTASANPKARSSTTRP